MAKVKNVPPAGRGTRRPGIMVQTKVRGGIPIMKTWPKKRGPIKSQAQKDTAEVFRLAQKAANEAHSWFFIEAENMSKGSIWNRRELLIMASTGMLYEIELPGGDIYGGWFNLAREIQALLDTVSSDIGTMLVRTGEGWIGLDPGVNGYYLQTNGPGFPPSWNPVAEPAPNFQWSSCQAVDNFSGSDICVGIDLTPAVDVEISDINFRLTPALGATYMLTIATMTSTSRVDTILQQFDVTAAVVAEGGAPVIPLPVLQILDKATRYLFLVSKSNGAAGSGMAMSTSRGNGVPIPSQTETFIRRGSFQVPAPNNLLATTNSTICFNFKWREV